MMLVACSWSRAGSSVYEMLSASSMSASASSSSNRSAWAADVVVGLDAEVAEDPLLAVRASSPANSAGFPASFLDDVLDEVDRHLVGVDGRAVRYGARSA